MIGVEYNRMATNEAMRKYRHSPGYQFHAALRRYCITVQKLELLRRTLMELSGDSPELRSLVPHSVTATLSPPPRRITSPGLEEESAWQIENLYTQTPEQHARLTKYKEYCRQRGLDPFPHHEKEAPAVSDEFRLLDAKFDRTHAEGYDGDEVWTDEDDERHLKFFTKQKEQK